VDEEKRRLQENLDANIIVPPTTHPWGRRATQFVDPDGYEKLYNLKQDQSETRNLVDVEPAKPEGLSRSSLRRQKRLRQSSPRCHVPKREQCEHFAVVAVRGGGAFLVARVVSTAIAGWR
jgi:hypothetical protein